MKLLILSNGHGEDVIAVKIVEQLQHHFKASNVVVLPLVGKGYAYQKINVPIIGSVKQMPSGGFINTDRRQLWKDVKEGLLKLTKEQYQIVRQWGQEGGKILAVGDILPLGLAWLSGADYAFVGTAKSEYYLQDNYGWFPQTPWIYRWSGSYYFPWERFLMSRPRCKAVFPRDTITTKVLQQWSIPAFDLGNPMMDDIYPRDIAPEFKSHTNNLTILLLPGSRNPEAQQNWHIIMNAVQEIISTFKHRELIFLGAIYSALPLEFFQNYLIDLGWQLHSLEPLTFIYKNARLMLSQNAYVEYLRQAQIAIAMAGTATEQFVGLGKPAITIVGEGPQFTYTFAEAQTRLLGISVILVQEPSQVAQALQSLLQDPDRWQEIIDNGQRRMGLPGAAKRIAQCIIERLR